MSDTTDTTKNKREDDPSDRAIDVYHLVHEWSLQGTCGDPLNAGAKTDFNENVAAQIFGKMASFDLRKDPFSFEVKPKTNGHVDLLDFVLNVLQAAGTTYKAAYETETVLLVSVSEYVCMTDNQDDYTT